MTKNNAEIKRKLSIAETRLTFYSYNTDSNIIDKYQRVITNTIHHKTRVCDIQPETENMNNLYRQKINLKITLIIMHWPTIPYINFSSIGL